MATEPLWYIQQMQNEANRESYDEPVEHFHSYDEAITWCAECAGPIFDGQPIAHLPGYTGASVDRHGQTYVFHMPEMAWHANPRQCR
jgi:hypothetical protein